MTIAQARTAGFTAFVRGWWHQIAISSGSIWLVAAFGQGHDILPLPVAWILAIGWEAVYIRGLSQSSTTTSRWGAGLIWISYGTVILWGILHILSLPAVGVVPAKDLGWVWGSVIAVAHVIPMALTGLCSAMLHRAATGERPARERGIADRREDALLEIELEERRKRADLLLWEEASAARARVKASLAVSSAVSLKTLNESAPPRLDAKDTSREDTKAAILKTLEETPTISKKALADAVGISRGHLYTLLGELKKASEEV